MNAFVKAAELGSFAAAANDLRISATMVGLHVKALEDELGVLLLHRTTRRQNLTEVGRVFFQRAKRVIAEAAEADAAVAAFKAAPVGQLRVTAPVGFGVHCLGAAIADYLMLYPDVDVELVLQDRQVDLLEDSFEAAIRVGELPVSGLIARPLKPFALQVCASSDYVARHGAPLRPEDLAEHNCLGFSYGGTDACWRFRVDGETVTVPVRGNLRINSGDALCAAARAGLGVIMIPKMMVAEDIKVGRLVPLMLDFVPPPRPMHLVYPPDRTPTPKFRSFVDFILMRYGAAAHGDGGTPVPAIVADEASSD